MGQAYKKLKSFMKKYPGGVHWRLKQHCEVIDLHLNPNEELKFIVAGQLDNKPVSFLNTAVLAITSERLLIAQNYVLAGYKFSSITPDLYNDMQVYSRILWGIVCIDTVKEKIYLSNLPIKALPKIETEITMFMQEAKKKYYQDQDN